MQSTGGFVCGRAHSPQSDQNHVHSQTADGRLSTNSTFSDGIKNSQNELVLYESRLQQVSPYIPARLFFVYVYTYRHIWINGSFWCVFSAYSQIYIYIYIYIVVYCYVLRLVFVVRCVHSIVVYCVLLADLCFLLVGCRLLFGCLLCIV